MAAAMCTPQRSNCMAAWHEVAAGGETRSLADNVNGSRHVGVRGVSVYINVIDDAADLDKRVFALAWA